MDNRKKNRTRFTAPLRLEKLLRYLIQANPRGLMKVLYAHGALPYNYRESIQDYLLKNSLVIIRDESDAGIRALLAAHPDRELILETFSLASSDPAAAFSAESEEDHYSGAPSASSPIVELGAVGIQEPGGNWVAVLAMVFILCLIIYLLFEKK